jgi:hypothetical protein
MLYIIIIIYVISTHEDIDGVGRQMLMFAQVVSVRVPLHTPAYVSIRQHTSAYVGIRQHTSADVSIRQHTSAYVGAPVLRWSP